MIWVIVLLLLVLLYLLVDRLLRVFKIGNHSNKYVFVTGCDSGFGRELVLRLDKLGFPVFAACYTDEGRQTLTQVCSSRVQVIPFDVTKEESIQAALDTVRQKLPSETSLWAVVNNAGVIGQVVAAEICNKKEYQFCSDVNLFGPIESKGRLINLTSCMGRCAAEAGPYCVSKFGLEAFSDVLRREVAQFGIKVCLVEPGYTETALFHVDELHKGIREAFQRSDPEIQEAYGKNYPDYVIAVLTAKLERCSSRIEKVVDALLGAIVCKYPRPRTVVGYDAKFLFIPLTFLPEWVGDTVLLAYEKRMAKEKGF
ncbi:unnamed protein product [Candidula unifasciata]|uniref:Retinol dehydrogenase 7 n=1 Tax=Candidula unifasciata TaxID=100452 RepID=A0A8S3ZAS3_9EUPU|nr:unnamed protein product [Candidula unifasciata]